jgi:chemotaxis protein methyltransferase CheR
MSIKFIDGVFVSKVLLTDEEFKKMVDVVYKSSGIYLSDAKKELVVSRVLKRLYFLQINDFKEYISYLDANLEKELSHLISAITTNLTYFFREEHHFEYIFKNILPVFHKENPYVVFRVYSAGCSSGEEVLSCAVLFERFKLLNPAFRYEVLGVDIDQKMIDFASFGVYSSASLEHMEDRDKRLIFDKGTGSNTGFFKVKNPVLKNIIYMRESILEKAVSGSVFDLIFCRNVLIYFDDESQVRALRVFYSQISKNGHLFLGHSESMVGKQNFFSLVAQTIYGVNS